MNATPAPCATTCRKRTALASPAPEPELRRYAVIVGHNRAHAEELDIPLLFEGRKARTGGASALPFDATVLVYAPEQAQVERQISRDGCDRDEAMRRIRSQLPIEDKKAMADLIIDNSGDPAETERQVRALFIRFTGSD